MRDGAETGRRPSVTPTVSVSIGRVMTVMGRKRALYAQANGRTATVDDIGTTAVAVVLMNVNESVQPGMHTLSLFLSQHDRDDPLQLLCDKTVQPPNSVRSDTLSDSSGAKTNSPCVTQPEKGSDKLNVCEMP